MNIRFATIDDLPAILAISNYYAETSPANFALEPETLEMWMESFHDTRKMHPWLVSTQQVSGTGEGTSGEIVTGFAKSSPWKGRCAYNWSAETTVYVGKDYQHKGIGRALYARLIDVLRKQGYRTILGGITQPNVASVKLHEAFGYRKVALLERVGYKFGRWHDVGYWLLDLVQDDAGSMGRPPEPILPVAMVEPAR
ncbi:MAG: GNAT family N-acetyltransferase [Phycisphaerales bacterium]